ncbi:MAG TPA: BamA/TamA family outer membrane protein [Vicinamibacterales bacterium]|nr:BamA/TamA family outer membrane protein [Vicinamibacterales bacterium]
MLSWRMQVSTIAAVVITAAVAAPPAFARQAPAEDQRSWMAVPLVSSSPKLGTSFGVLGAYVTKFDPDSRVSIFGAMYQYTTTKSSIAAAFARTSFRADHQRVIAIAAFGAIKNDYQDYLGTGQPLQTDDNLKSVAARYLYRVGGDWFVGAQGNAANYQVLGANPEDELVLETLGVRGFASAALGAVVMHDSRDNLDMPTGGWYANVNNLAYREALGGANSFDAYRVDAKYFVRHGKAHVLAFRQFNWLTHEAPAGAQATVVLRGYKFGQYLAPYMSSFEVEERLLFGRRLGATLFAGLAGLYGTSPTPLDRQTYPMVGAGLQFIIMPDKHMLASLEYAQGIEDNHGLLLKLGYAW